MMNISNPKRNNFKYNKNFTNKINSSLSSLHSDSNSLSNEKIKKSN
jgi:hypothetical protein